MVKLIDRLTKEKALSPPKWLSANTIYLTLMGSVTYGCATDTSDKDVYGVCIPKKESIFPLTSGLIRGFDDIQGFDQFQQHHCKSTDGNEYDFSVHSVVKYFRLAMDNNPNIIDSLFTRREHVLHSTTAWEEVRSKRHLFLHKGAWHKFRGYAFSQLHKMKIKSPRAGSKRQESVEKYGMDVKFAYHIVRLLNECEQIFTTGDIDLMQDRERLKSIRRGEWTMERITEFFEQKEKSLEILYNDSTIIPYSPDKVAIKRLLINVLEEHYGSLDEIFHSKKSDSDRVVEEIRRLVN